MESQSWDIKWNDNMSVGISEIDNDHKTLINLINNFNQSVVDSMAITLIKDNLQNIIRFIEQHCVREEAILEQHGYPDVADHAYKHQQLEETLHKIIQGVGDYSVDYGWIDAGLKVKQEKIKHFLNEDMNYMKYLRTH